MNAVQVIKDICVGSKLDNREALLAYEEVAKTLPQVEIPVMDKLHGGMYYREIVIPAGTILTGDIYRFNHLDIMISGDITVSTDTGEVKRLTGYNCLEGLSGKKRAGYAHADTHWITVHSVNRAFKNGNEAQAFLTANSFEDLIAFESLVNRADFEQLIAASGMTIEEVTAQVENLDDQIDMPLGYDNLYTGASPIHGIGMYSTTSLHIGDVIGPARVGDKRTPLGRYTNHAINANAEILITDSDIVVVATRDIARGEEITMNYRKVFSTRNSEGDLCPE